MSNNAPALPRDKNGTPLQESPPAMKAKTQTASENATVSAILDIGHDTTAIDVTAVDKTAFVRWIAATGAAAGVTSVIAIAGATSNYDVTIPAGTVRRLVVPIESPGTAHASVQGVNRAEGLYSRLAYKSAGISSVLTTEY